MLDRSRGCAKKSWLDQKMIDCELVDGTKYAVGLLKDWELQSGQGNFLVHLQQKVQQAGQQFVLW